MNIIKNRHRMFIELGNWNFEQYEIFHSKLYYCLVLSTLSIPEIKQQFRWIIFIEKI